MFIEKDLTKWINQSLCTTWYIGIHLPKTYYRHYLKYDLKSLKFRVFNKHKVVRQASQSAQTIAEQFKKEKLVVLDQHLSPERLKKLQELIQDAHAKEIVQRKKKKVKDPKPYTTFEEQGPPGDYFSVMQHSLDRYHQNKLLTEILPELKDILELSRNRRLMCLAASYQHNDKDDPMFDFEDNRYIGHTVHRDGSPRFVKALLYLEDTDEQSGPFEIIPGSRLSLLKELLMVAYLPRNIGKRASWVHQHIPQFFRRPTHGAPYSKEFLDQHASQIVGKKGSLVIFDGMMVHGGSRNQEKPREAFQFVFE